MTPPPSNPSMNGSGPYVTERMFLSTTERIEGKVDKLAEQISLALPRIAATEKTDDDDGVRHLRHADRTFQTKLVLLANLSAAVVSVGVGLLLRLTT